MPWYELLESIYNYLLDNNAADQIIQGLPEASSIVDIDTTLIAISRGTEQMDNVYDGGEGNVTLYLNFVTANKDPEISSSYEALNALEQKAVDLIKEWANQNIPCPSMDVFQVKFTQAGGDALLVRPHIGSYLDVSIDFSLREI